jgi:hypothetical protein
MRSWRSPFCIARFGQAICGRNIFSAFCPAIAALY